MQKTLLFVPISNAALPIRAINAGHKNFRFALISGRR
jgi:hypothetical protein